MKNYQKTNYELHDFRINNLSAEISPEKNSWPIVKDVATSCVVRIYRVEPPYIDRNCGVYRVVNNRGATAVNRV